MTLYIARKMVERLSKWGLISLEQREDYLYELQVMIEKIVGFTILLVLSIFHRLIVQTIAFWIYFSFLRRYTGGFHAKSFWGCIATSAGLYEIYVWIIYPSIYKGIELWELASLFVSLILILRIGTINHPDMQLDEGEYRLCKRRARIVVVVETVTIMVCRQMGINRSYILFMTFGVCLCAGMLLVAKLVKQEVKYDAARGRENIF